MTEKTTGESEFNPEYLKEHTQKLAPDGWELNPPNFKRIRNWNMLMFQLATAAETLGILITDRPEFGSLTDFSKQYALFTSFVLAYSKCFSSVGSNQIKLNADDIFQEVKHFRIYHDEILIIRNKMIAHNDTTKYTKVDISVLESDSGYRIRQAVALSLPRDKYEDWLELTKYVQQRAILKINKALDSLQKQLGKEIHIGGNG